MTVRPTNCHLTGDQLAISGAVADAADNTARDGQCPVPPQQARNLGDEVAAADLARHPARLVLLQDGADDIDFARCLEYQLAQRPRGRHRPRRRAASPTAPSRRDLAADLANVRTSLARAIEAMAPHAGTIAVLDYYQPIPGPSQIADDTVASRLHTNLVCTGLKANAGSTYAAAQVVLGALNRPIAGAVADARAHHVTNVDPGRRRRRLRRSRGLHGRPVGLLGRAGARRDPGRGRRPTSWPPRRAPAPTPSMRPRTAPRWSRAADGAEKNLQGYVWRAAHPTAAGQRAIAAAVERLARAAAV